jgi:hypothetical protein
MLNRAVLSSIAAQLMTTSKVELDGKRLPTRRIGHLRLKSVTFATDGHE